MTLLRRMLVVTLVLMAGSSATRAQNPADAAWASGDFETARRLYAERLAADSSDIRALHRMALLFAWNEQYQESLALFDHLLMVAPENVDARVDRARVLSWTGKFEESINSFEEALERHPGDRQVLLGLAQVLSWADRIDSALTIYDGLVAADSTDIQARHGLARAAAWRGNLVDAERLWRETLAHDEANAETLMGLSQTLRWQGRPDAAREVLAQVPDEARMTSAYMEEERWIAAALDPRLTPSLIFEFDSDDNTMVTLLLRGEYPARPRLRVGLETYYRYARGVIDYDPRDISSRRAYGFAATGQLSVEPGWTIRGGLGASGATGTTAKTQLSGRASITSPGRYRYGGTFEVSRAPLDATALLIQNGVSFAQAALSLRAQPAYRWTVEAGGSWARFQGSEANRRLVGYAAATRRIAPPWTAAARLRTFGFEKSRQDGFFDGYFNPDFYFYGELIGRWQPLRGQWNTMIELAPGLEQVGTEGSLRAAGRVMGRIEYNVAPGRQIGLSALYANNGLQAFATGDEGYRYFALTLSGTWVF